PTFGEGEKLLVTSSTHNDYGIRKTDDPLVQAKLVSRLYSKIMNNREKIIDYDSCYMEDAEVVVVCYGFTARSALFAIEKLRGEGKKVGMFRLKTMWPFPDRLIRDIGSRAKKILVPEMNKGQVVEEVMKYASCDAILYSQTNGEDIHPNAIIEQLRRLV
ncbi:unnamed protein product, partial [marine sediment metagenome]